MGVREVYGIFQTFRHGLDMFCVETGIVDEMNAAEDKIVVCYDGFKYAYRYSDIGEILFWNLEIAKSRADFLTHILDVTGYPYAE